MMFHQRHIHRTKAYVRLMLFVTAAILVYFPVTSSAAPLTDDSVKSAVEDELIFDQAVPFYSISVGVIDGVATLTGTVDNILSKDRATAIAETVKGVRSVINRITVDTPVEKTDSRLESDITDALLKNPATEFYEVTPNAEKGVVTLEGTVGSYKEKNLSETVTKGVSGVSEVINNIRVIYTPARPEKEIQADIVQTLRWDTLVDHELIKVDVAGGGVVTLSGTVGSAAEKSRAQLLSWVAGVSDIKAGGLKVNRWARDPDLRKTKYADISDAQIKEAVERALSQDPRILGNDVGVRVDEGVVTLTGSVTHLRASQAAEMDTRNTVGVFRVKNHLKVNPNTTAGDAELEEDIREALRRDAFVNPYGITVNVTAGVAELDGKVDTYFYKTRVEDVAASVSGILWVNNDLEVTRSWDPFVFNSYVDEPTVSNYSWYSYDGGIAKKGDWVIEQDIESELWWSPFVDADQVEVSVDDGRATLTGTVDSWPEYNAATENALEGGAVSVDNDLEISYLND